MKVLWNLHRKPYACTKRPHKLMQLPQDWMINCRITFKNKLQATDTGPKRPVPQGNNFLCSLSLYITHPSFGRQFQLFTCCQIYFQVSTFLLCHCIFPFSRNALALRLLALQAPGSNVKCVWGLEGVCWFWGFFKPYFLSFVLAQLLHYFTQEKLVYQTRVWSKCASPMAFGWDDTNYYHLFRVLINHCILAYSRIQVLILSFFLFFPPHEKEIFSVSQFLRISGQNPVPAYCHVSGIFPPC